MTSKQPLDRRMVWGLLLAAFGFLLLLQNLDILPFRGHFTVSLFFLGGGLAFLALFLTDRANWWAVIPAAALGGIGLLIGSDALLPGIRHFGGFIFLGTLSLAFWAIYFARRDEFWPIIPGGVLATLAVVTLSPGVGGGGLFFFGLAATFGLVYVLSANRERVSWALIPAAVLGAIGVIILGFSIARWAFPLLLVLLGVYLLSRGRQSSDGQ